MELSGAGTPVYSGYEDAGEATGSVRVPSLAGRTIGGIVLVTGFIVAAGASPHHRRRRRLSLRLPALTSMPYSYIAIMPPVLLPLATA